jgi:hypothetical protein
MVDEDRSNQEINDREELERALALLKPASSRIDRDNFLFLAGRASVEPIRPGGALRQWMWPAATLLSTLAALVLFALLITRPQSGWPVAQARQTDAPEYVTVGKFAPAAPEKVSAGTVSEGRDAAVEGNLVQAVTSFGNDGEIAAASNYPRLRSLVLAYGIEALPEPTALPRPAGDSALAEPRTERELFKLLSKSRG